MSKAKKYDGTTPLKGKMEQFCHEYIIDMNATGSARRAGYSEKSCEAIGFENLRKPKIIARIAYLKKQNMQRVANKTEMQVTADRVLEEIGRLALSNIVDYTSFTEDGHIFIDVNKATPAQMAAISSLEVIEMPPVTMIGSGGETIQRQVLKVKLKMWDKPKALEMFMKHYGLLQETVKIEGLDKMIENLQKGRARVAAIKD